MHADAPLSAPPAALETLSGPVERVVFHNPESGFTVLRLKLADRREPVTVVGESAQAGPGTVVRARGSWQDDPSFGRQFRARAIEVMPPTTLEGIEAYLGSGMIKGIGPAMAKKLTAAFGEQVFEVIERDPVKLRRVPGIGRATAGRIAAAWEQQRAVRDLMLFLHGHGISPLRASRIFEIYGRRALEVVTANPYRLAEDVRGVGFASADQLAHRLGIPDDSPYRLKAGLDHVLGEAQAQGHCGLPHAELLARAAGLLGAAADYVDAELARAIAAGELREAMVESTRCIFLPALADAEERIAKALLRLAAARPSWSVDDLGMALDDAERALGMALATGQRDALRQALTRKLLVITGGPGTGKTTLVRAILKALEAQSLEVLLAAPTGRAARRLGDSTGAEARTLHRLLEAEVGRGFRRGAARPLACDLLIVDEMSMVDVPLMDAMLGALPQDAGLLLIGDHDQLPSVGPGQVLADLIDSGRLPLARLDEVFRQAGQSLIVRNAHRINRGLLPERDPEASALSDFYAIRAQSPEDAVRLVVELVGERVPGRFGVDPLDGIQVLTPVNRGPCGARRLNEVLQVALNGEQQRRLSRGGHDFAQGDKVMQIENDYEREVYNGDIGRIVDLDADANTLTVEIDGRPHTYGGQEIERLLPAYAITVHKAQGSEYPVVVLPLVREHGRMLRRNLLYTAVTRARRLVVLVVEAGVLERAIAGRPEPRRWSRLRPLLEAVANVPDDPPEGAPSP